MTTVGAFFYLNRPPSASGVRPARSARGGAAMILTERLAADLLDGEPGQQRLLLGDRGHTRCRGGSS